MSKILPTVPHSWWEANSSLRHDSVPLQPFSSTDQTWQMPLSDFISELLGCFSVVVFVHSMKRSRFVVLRPSLSPFPSAFNELSLYMWWPLWYMICPELTVCPVSSSSRVSRSHFFSICLCYLWGHKKKKKIHQKYHKYIKSSSAKRTFNRNDISLFGFFR